MVLKRLSLWCVVALSALVLFGCSEGFDRKTGTYTDKGKGFTVQFPAGWDKTKPPPGAIFSVADSDNKANINNDYPSLEATFDGVATSFRFLS